MRLVMIRWNCWECGKEFHMPFKDTTFTLEDLSRQMEYHHVLGGWCFKCANILAARG